MKKSNLYLFFTVLFTSCVLISNIIAIKTFQVGPWTLPCAVIVFPISYIMSDVIAEVYGFAAARKTMWLGFSMNLLMVIMFQITIALPAPSYFTGQEAVAMVMGNTPRLLVSGLISYIVGSWANATVLSAMKRKTAESGGKGFGARAVVSTLVGEFIDSLIFIPLAFYGTMPLDSLGTMILLQPTVKTVYEILVLPFTYRLVAWVKKTEGIDTYDVGVQYKLFGKV